MYNLPRTYNNCNTTVDSSEHIRKLSSTISSCTACKIDNTNCCQINADAIQEINDHLVIVDNSINYIYITELSEIDTLVNDISQNVYDNSQSIIELNNEVDDLSGVIQDLSATVQDLSASVYDLSGEIYSLPGVVADLSGVVADLSGVVLDLSGDFNTLSPAFTDLSGVVADLSTVVLDLSGDFNTLSPAFTDLSGVVANLSTVVLDLSGDFNTLSPAFTDLSGVVADLSTVVLDLSGDFNTQLIAFTDLSGVVADLSAVVLDLSGDFNTLSTAFTDLSGVVADLSAVVLDLSGDFNTLSPAFTDLSGVVADVSNSKVDRAGDTMTGNLVLDAKLVLSTDANDVFITKTGTGNKSLLLQAGDDNSSTDDFAIQFNVRNATGIVYNSLYIDGKNNNIQANREVIVYNQNYATSGVRTFINTGGSNSYPFIATGDNAVGGAPSSVTDIAHGFGMMYKTDGNMDIVRYFGTAGVPAAVMNFNRDNGNTRVKRNLFIDGYVGVSGEGILFDSSSPASTSNRLYRNGNDLYWDNDRLSVWDESGTSLVLDLSYDNIIIPGSTTQLGVDRTNKTAYFETDLSNIKFNVQGNNAITIDNSGIDLSGTVNFSDTLSAKQGLNISTYTPGTTTQTLYTLNGTDLYWNGSIIGSDISAVVQDLSTVVLDLSSDFNTLSPAFTDLSGVVADLSGNVTDISNNKVSKSGDTMTGNLTISKSTPQLLLTDTSSSNNSSINVDSNGLMLNVNSSEVLKLSGPNATGTNPFITVRNTFGNSSRMRFLNPNDVNDVFDIGIHNSTLGNERFIDYNGYQLGIYGSGVKTFNGGSVILNTDLSLNHGLTLNAATAPASTTNKLYRVDSDVYWDGQKLSVWDTSGTSLVIDASYNELIIPGSTTKLGVDSGNNKAYLETDLSSIELNFPNNKVLKLDGAATGASPVMSLNNENASADETSIRLYDPSNANRCIKLGMTNVGLGLIYMDQTNRFRIASNSGNILDFYDTYLNLNRNLIIDGSDNSSIYSQIKNTSTSGNAKLLLTSSGGTQGTTELLCNGSHFEFNHRANTFFKSGDNGTNELTLKKRTILRSEANTDNYFGIEEVSDGYYANLTCYTADTEGRLKAGAGWNYFYAARPGYSQTLIWSTEATYFKINVIGYNKDGNTISSDRRIKKNIQEIKDDSALQIIKKIEPKTYNYIDLHRQKELVYGFIAQEVAEVLPAAVNIIRDTIPDILKNVSISGDIITFETETELIVGNQVEIRKSTTVNYGEEVTIVSKINSNTYKIETKRELEFTNGFCYGHYVDDFHYLCKDKLLPILWSATQQVIKEQDLLKLKVQTLEIEKNVLTNKAITLEQDNATLKQDNALLKQQVADMEARLKLIEAKLQI